ncbi:hypothetical protein [uncultured Psychrobacter sp.]|uniref:hypothetical protein n=1 Tax=uncultured Psychrobacter sp. TaxID=259303 RepID=UPI0034587CC9
MSILKNAVDSIAIGLEDFESADKRRIVSSARNIFAGILLLFKYKLCELSPIDSDEALIKQKVLPAFDATGVVNWVGKGNKTVDVQNIKERFKSLGVIVEWQRLDRINKYRNDIEHYYSTLNNESVQQLISDSFIIIRNFIVDELDEDPKQLLGEEYWKILVDVNEVYEKEKQECNSSLLGLKYFNNKILCALQAYNCAKCGSGLIESTLNTGHSIESLFKCRSCENELYYEDIVNDAIDDYFADDLYLSHKDGDDAPVIECPSCFDGRYLFHEELCVICGDSATHECSRCGISIPPEEISDGDICGYCSHMWDKLMKE